MEMPARHNFDDQVIPALSKNKGDDYSRHMDEFGAYDEEDQRQEFTNWTNPAPQQQEQIGFDVSG